MKQRQSNIELLRILAIFCVLMGHGCWMVLGMPSSKDISEHFTLEFSRLLIGGLTIGSVNVFVLISGWFGIHPSAKGLGKFLYQIAFLLWGIYIVFLLTGNAAFSLSDIQPSMGIYEGYWFIMAYLGMYILSPILNEFTEKASKKQFELTLAALFIFQCYYCWGWSMVNYFSGYSLVFFCFLYLLARYVRIYPISIINNHYLSIYVVSSIAISLIACIGIWLIGSPMKMLRYDNPLTILSALGLLVTFSKIKITSKFINQLAKSCFAVYIIHFNPFIFPYFKKGATIIANNYNGLLYALIIFCYLIVVYLGCSSVDRLRLLTWSMITKKA